MILLFNHIPVTLQGKVDAFLAKVKAAYGSEFYNLQGKYWKGDDLSVDSLFPDWIINQYKSNSLNAPVVTIVKNYLRWLLSVDYGYGAQADWQTIRDPFHMHSIFLEALAEYYFPGADFASDELSSILPNIRRFAVKADLHYFNMKGTPTAIKYVLTTLLGMSYNTTIVSYSSPGIITITGNVNNNYKEFLKTYVYPAGVIVNYQSI
jgi:hypothetical protein